MRKLLMATLAGAAIAAATPASAVTVITNPGPTGGATSCSSFTFSAVTEVGCAGGFNNGPGQGNLIQGTLQDPGLAAIQALGYSGTGAYVGNVTISGNTLNFSTALSGLTIIGIHYGGGGDSGGEATSFFSLLVPAGTTSITVSGRTLGGANSIALSNGALFSTNGPVPEPATWAMMLLGFGGIGMALRRGRRAPSLAKVA